MRCDGGSRAARPGAHSVLSEYSNVLCIVEALSVPLSTSQDLSAGGGDADPRVWTNPEAALLSESDCCALSVTA